MLVNVYQIVLYDTVKLTVCLVELIPNSCLNSAEKQTSGRFQDTFGFNNAVMHFYFLPQGVSQQQNQINK